jgi:glutamate-1-semialdehyde 2,1-aminomutase
MMFERSKKVQPAGVSYSNRYFTPYPFFVKAARGAKLYDIDDNVYTDYWCTHYAMILGHAHPLVMEALSSQVQNGWHFGFVHELEVLHAEKICQHVPSAEMVRYTSSGSEANLFAIRLARTYTRRSKIAKFEGCWHGAYDPLHLAIKPPFDQLPSGGITRASQEDTIVVPYNDLNGFLDRVKNQELACVILEPVLGAGGMIPAQREFLQGLREYCDQKGALLIFDEIITGFRLGLGGAQVRFNVIPDITVLGKIIGGGLPIGAICGKREIMIRIDHTKYSGIDLAYHGGTFAGNALSLRAGLATINVLEDSSTYNHLHELGEKVRLSLNSLFANLEYPATVTGIDSLLAIHIYKDPPEKSILHDVERSRRLFLWMLENRIIMFSPELQRGAVSCAHTHDDVDFLISTVESYVKETVSAKC